MNIDDIMNAAVYGDLYQLQSMLDTRTVNLNQPIDCGVENGQRITVPLLYSVLYHMQTGPLNYDVLNLLIRYGADVNGVITLDDGTELMQIPLLTYAIADWNSLEMVKFLLQNGANPNIPRISTFYNGAQSVFSMLYFAISHSKNLDMIKALLDAHADSNAYNTVYLSDRNCYQYLPPIYYALAEQQNSHMCKLLLQYGASPQIEIDLGYGIMKRIKFQTYVATTYPHLSGLLNPSDKEKCKKISTGFRKSETVPPTRKKPSPIPEAKSTRRCYRKLTAYSFANFGFLTIGLLFGGLSFLSSEPEVSVSLFVFGAITLLICLSIWKRVSKKARKSGQVGVMGTFVLDSILIFAKVLCYTMIILIPIAKAICSDVQWEERKTKTGRSVFVKKRYDGTYDDGFGNRYEDEPTSTW